MQQITLRGGCAGGEGRGEGLGFRGFGLRVQGLGHPKTEVVVSLNESTSGCIDDTFFEVSGCRKVQLKERFHVGTHHAIYTPPGTFKIMLFLIFYWSRGMLLLKPLTF